jgi:hypothetical protein
VDQTTEAKQQIAAAEQTSEMIRAQGDGPRTKGHIRTVERDGVWGTEVGDKIDPLNTRFFPV